MTERNVGRPWTEYEDRLLIQAVAVHGENDNWKQIAVSIPGRTNKACRKRWLHSLSPSVKKSAWTREEDELLLSLYAIHSTKWSIIARNIPGRTDDACSKRYREALDPALKKGDWTPDEDLHLLDAYRRLGGKWGQIGTELSRSGLGCRNRWRLLDRKRATVTHGTFSDSHDSNACGSQHPAVAWPNVPMVISNELWDQTGLGSHTSTPLCCPEPCDTGMNLNRPPTPPPFQFSSSSLSTALSNPELSYPSTPPRNVPVPCPDRLPTTYSCNSEQCCPQRQLLVTSSISDTSTHVADVPTPSLTDGVSPRDDDTPCVTPNDNPVDPGFPAPIASPPSTPFVDDQTQDMSSSPTTRISLDLLGDRSMPAAGAPTSPIRSKKRIKHATNPRLSSCLPVDSNKTLFAYVCGHETCWPPSAQHGSLRFATSKELWDHSKFDHGEAMGGTKPFRCGLDGCGKGWKSINGLQYHLQVSKTHFREALLTQFPQTSNNQSSTPESPPYDREITRQQKKYSCPHGGCPNEYRQKSGLRYHLSHGHPIVTPVQLQCVPPALAEKMNKPVDS